MHKRSLLPWTMPRPRPLRRPVWLSGCALNGDFGRVRRGVVYDDMQVTWVGRDAVCGVLREGPRFTLTDDERQLRDPRLCVDPAALRPHPLGQPVRQFRLGGPAPDAPSADPLIGANLDLPHRRSEASAYAQVVTDARNDVTRIEPFFAVAGLVTDADRK